MCVSAKSGGRKTHMILTCLKDLTFNIDCRPIHHHDSEWPRNWEAFVTDLQLKPLERKRVEHLWLPWICLVQWTSEMSGRSSRDKHVQERKTHLKCYGDNGLIWASWWRQICWSTLKLSICFPFWDKRCLPVVSLVSFGGGNEIFDAATSWFEFFLTRTKLFWRMSSPNDA